MIQPKNNVMEQLKSMIILFLMQLIDSNHSEQSRLRPEDMHIS